MLAASGSWYDKAGLIDIALQLVRFYIGDRTAITDFFVLLCIERFAFPLQLWSDIVSFLTVTGLAEIGASGISRLALCIVAICTLFLIYSRWNGTHLGIESAAVVKNPGPLNPLIFPSQTSHTRFFPEKHSFTYSYLLVGIPIGWHGRAGSLLSTDNASSRAWFHVAASDHLERDKSITSLEQKLSSFLQSQGASAREFASAYLVTAPKFLGYNFNPVSFWYLYDAEQSLRAVILEVNNTFDERRPYFLRIEEDQGECCVEEAASSSSRTFSTRWTKDFHVSPFNDRTGSYSLKSQDPLHSSTSNTKAAISNVISLTADDGKTKLVASICSSGNAIDPTHLSLSPSTKVLLLWCWVGFLTFPRILFEAWRLFFQKHLDVWFRPEVTKESIGRRPTSDEVHLESHFSRYLEHTVMEAELPVTVRYKPAPLTGKDVTREFRSQPASDKTFTMIDIEVLSPAFYSRFTHYSHTKEALGRESLFTDKRNRTLFISKPQVLLSHIPFEPASRSSSHKNDGTNWTGNLNELRWQVLQRLRCPPPAPSYSNAGGEHGAFKVEDIRVRPFSELDLFVKRRGVDDVRYRKILSKQFMAQRYADGLTVLVSAADLGIRVLLLFASEAIGSRIRTRQRRTNIHWWYWICAMMAQISIHLWSLVVKGT